MKRISFLLVLYFVAVLVQCTFPVALQENKSWHEKRFSLDTLKKAFYFNKAGGQKRRLTTCTPKQDVVYQLQAGEPGEITVTGVPDASTASLNVVAFGQDCSSNLYADAPDTTIVSASDVIEGVKFSGIVPFSSGRFQVCVSCSSGAPHNFEAGRLTVTASITKAHRVPMYDGTVGFISVYGNGLDYIDRIILVSPELSCVPGVLHAQHAPSMKGLVPEINNNNTLARFGPVTPSNVTRGVEVYHICYAFDGVSFSKHIGNVTVRPIFELQAGFPATIQVRSEANSLSTNDRIGIVNFDPGSYDGCATYAMENTLNNVFVDSLAAVAPTIISGNSFDVAVFPESIAMLSGHYHLCLKKEGVSSLFDVGAVKVAAYINSTHRALLSVGFANSIVVSGFGLSLKNRIKIISDDKICTGSGDYKALIGAPTLESIAPSIEANGKIAIFPGVLVTTTRNYTLCYAPDPARGGFETLVGKLQTTCGDGLIYRKGSAYCSKCPPGYFNDVGKETSGCSSCLKGQYSVAFGSDKCSSCLPGRYSPEDNWRVECLPCQTGYFSDQNGTFACSECSSGKYTSVTSQENCLECTPGKFSIFSAASSCFDCDFGQSVDDYSAAICDNCEVGRYANATGSSVCASCGPGMYGPSLGLKDCFECSPGRYTSATGESECLKCAPGQYQDESGLPNCKACNVGQYRHDASDSHTCIPCKAGKYQDENGKAECKRCPQGRFQNLESGVNCTYCESRHYTPAAGATKCQSQCACQTGSYATSLSLFVDLMVVCHPCPEGYKCPRGKVVLNSTMLKDFPNTVRPMYENITCIGAGEDPSVAVHCPPMSPFEKLTPPGYYSPGNKSWTTKASIEKCPLGTHCLGGVVKSCVPGKYAPVIGLSECMLCPAGKYTDGNGSIACVQCPAGYFCPAGSIVPCKCGINNIRTDTCGPYTSFDLAAAGPQQFFCLEGSNFRLSALAGMYTVGGGVETRTEQLECELGHECIMGNRTICPGGRYMNEIGQSACKICNPGMFSEPPSDSSTNVVCKTCPLGRRAGKPEMTYCDNCTQGKYNNLPGQATCKNCNPGFYTNKIETVNCLGCSKGKWNAEPGRIDCDYCLPGTDTENNTAYTKCVACISGKVAPDTGTGACSLCRSSPPEYQDLSGQTTCKRCLPGRATNDIRTACEESGRNVDLRNEVTHIESYLYAKAENRIMVYFEVNNDPNRVETVGEETFSVKIQLEQVYAYELQYGTDRSFSDITRLGKIRGYILGHKEGNNRTHSVNYGDAGRCTCPDQIDGEGTIRCPLRTTQRECNSVEEWQVSGETQIVCIWEVPLMMYPCVSRLGSRFEGLSMFLCGNIFANTKENIFDDNVYARIVPVLMPDPKKIGDIPMLVPLRGSGSPYTENPNPFTKFLPYRTSKKCGDKRYLETRVTALNYGEGKLMALTTLVNDLYGDEFLPDAQKWECVPCPEGASCMGNVYWKGVKPLFGFWRARRPGMVEFYECNFEWACLGVKNLDLEQRGYFREGTSWEVSDFMPEMGVTHPSSEWAKKQFAFNLDEDGNVIENTLGDGADMGPGEDGNTTSNNTNLEQIVGVQIITENEEGVDLLDDFNLATVNHRERCMLGYRGPVCSLCLDDPKYFMSEEGCQLCEGNAPTTRDIINTILLGLLILLVAFCIYRMLANQFDNLEAMDAIIADGKLIVKIMMNFLQLLSSIPAIITIEMPPALFSFVVGLNFVNFDIGGLVGLPCIDAGNAYDSYMLDMYVMGGLVGAVVLKAGFNGCRKAGMCPKFCGGRLVKEDEGVQEEISARDRIRSQLANIKNMQTSTKLTKKQEYMRALLAAQEDEKKSTKGLAARFEEVEEEEEEEESPISLTELFYRTRKTVFMILLFFHTPTMVKTFNMFRCIDVDNINYLEMDLRIICWEPYHIRACLVAGNVAVVYGIGLPGGIFLFLMTKRYELHTPRMQAAFGFIMGDYKPYAFFWETVIIVQKMMLTGFLVLFYDRLVIQISLAIVLSAGYQIISSLYSPYDSYAAGMLNDITAAAETMVYLSAIARRAVESTPSENEAGKGDIIGVFIIAVLQLTFVGSVICAGLSVYDNVNAIEIDTKDVEWDDEKEEKTIRQRINMAYADAKKQITLHNFTYGLIGKPPKESDDNDGDDTKRPNKIAVPTTGLKRLPPHIQARINKKRRRSKAKSTGSPRRNVSLSPPVPKLKAGRRSDESQGRSGKSRHTSIEPTLKRYREKKIRKERGGKKRQKGTARKPKTRKSENVSQSNKSANSAFALTAERSYKGSSQKKSSARFSMTAEEI